MAFKFESYEPFRQYSRYGDSYGTFLVWDDQREIVDRDEMWQEMEDNNFYLPIQFPYLEVSLASQPDQQGRWEVRVVETYLD